MADRALTTKNPPAENPDWATAGALEIIAGVGRFNFADAVEIVAGRLRDAHRAGQLRGQETVRAGGLAT